MLKLFILSIIFSLACLGVKCNSSNLNYMPNLGFEEDYDKINDLRKTLFDSIPNMLEDLLIKPVVIEAKGKDKDGNDIYEKDVYVESFGKTQSGGKFFARTQEKELKLQKFLDDTQKIDNLNDQLSMENQLIKSLLSSVDVEENNQNKNNQQQQQQQQQNGNKQISEIDEKEINDILKEILGGDDDSTKEQSKELQQPKASQGVEKVKESVQKNEIDFLNKFIKPQQEQLENKAKKSLLNSNVQEQTNMYENQVKHNAVSDKQMNALNALSDFQNDHYQFIDSSYVYLEFDKPINKRQAEELFAFVSKLLALPLNSVQDLRFKDKYLGFKITSDKFNSTQVANKIYAERSKILNEKGLNIVSSGIGKEENKVIISKSLLNIDPKSEKFVIITVVSCVSVLLLLVILLSVFLIRRRAHLRQKLAEDVMPSKKKKMLDDEESLIRGDGNGNKMCQSWFKYLPFIKRSTKSCDGSSSSGGNDQHQSPASNQDYQELCRQRMQNKGSTKSTTSLSSSNTTVDTPGLVASGIMNSSSAINSTPIRVTNSVGSETVKSTDSNRSSTSSWSEEPINSFNMDITTGHVILSYMEEHLNDKNRLTKEWEDLCNYEPDLNKTEHGNLPQNMTKNRYSNILPYDHTRVKLTENKENDYINANQIVDDDPKNPAYIATQGPLIHTTSDFWHMVWEQGSVVIVSLCRTVEYGSLKCNQFWPANGFEVYDQKFEIHLVSEHVWCEDYLVRNFFLKNLETNQTRTVTQFHFLTWPENGVPQNIKSILDFRRKVNKSYKGKSSPIIVHCNDGIGRTGTYILIDMVLNKITKGAKEIDLAATLEYLRDQRYSMVKNKNQFEFSFAVITEEVQNMLKALSQ